MRQKDLIRISSLPFGQKSPMKTGVANGLNIRTEMRMSTEIANTFCFILATLTFAAIFHDNINYIAHHRRSTAGEEVRLSHPVDEHLPRIPSGVEAGSAASIDQQSGCSLLRSGCPLKP